MPASTSSSARRNRRRTYVAGAVLVAAAATAVYALTLGGSESDSHDSGTEQPAVAESPSSAPPPADKRLLALARRDADDGLAVGRKDAPVVLIEYSDFQCPFCGRFARETEPELRRSYVEKGLLRVEWRNFPLFGKESEQASLAGWAAGEQGKFWQFHKIAYSEPRKRNSGEFSDDKLVAMAEQAGVPDLKKFGTDMTSERAQKAVAKDQNEGYDLGVTSTPAFLINGRPVLGAQPTKAFKAAIEAGVREARK